MSLDVNSASNTIPIVHTQAFYKVINISLSCYMVFVKGISDDACVLKNASYETKEEIEMFNFLKEFQDVFTNGILEKLSPKRGQDAHSIDIIPASSPPNTPPYRVLSSSTGGDYEASKQTSRERYGKV